MLRLTVHLTDERWEETFTAQINVNDKHDAARALESVLKSHDLMGAHEQIDFIDLSELSGRRILQDIIRDASD